MVGGRREKEKGGPKGYPALSSLASSRRKSFLPFLLQTRLYVRRLLQTAFMKDAPLLSFSLISLEEEGNIQRLWRLPRSKKLKKSSHSLSLAFGTLVLCWRQSAESAF